MRTWLWLSAPLISVLLASPCSAAEEAVVLEAVQVTGEVEPSYTVDQSSAATPLALSPRETPQSLTVITRERLDDQNLQSLRDVLDVTPGVYSYAYDSERVVFVSRGFIIDSLLYDGVPATTNSSTDSVDETLETALYERIEIVRGATGLTTGAGNPAAAINLVRKHAESRSFLLDTDFTLGSWDDRRAQLDLSAPLNASGSVRGRLVGVYQHRESYQDFYENEKSVLYGIVDADISADTRLSLGYDFQQTLPQSNTWGSFPLFFSDGTRTDWPRSVTTSTDWSFWNKSKQTAFAELSHRFAGEWSLRGTLSQRWADEDLALFYVDGFPDRDSGLGLIPYAYRNTIETRQTSVDLHASGPFRLFGREHELVVGYNGSRLDVSGDEYPHEELPDTGNFYQWDGSYPMPVFGAATHILDVDQRDHGLYLAARLRLAERLKLIAGLRQIETKREYFYVYSGSTPYDESRSHSSPYAGLIWDFHPQFSAFASYTDIYKPQNVRDPQGRILEPLAGESIEAGVKGEHFGKRLNTALTIFQTRQDRVPTPAFDPVTGEPLPVPGEPNTQASNPIDGTKTRGFELEASGSPLPGWNLSFGWTRYLLQGPDGETIRGYIPQTLVRGFSSYTPRGDWNRLTLGGGVNFQSGSTLDVFGPEGLTNISQGSLSLVSLFARYRFSEAVSLQLNGNNLLDKKYYVFDEYGNLYYGTPASAAVTLSLQF